MANCSSRTTDGPLARHTMRYAAGPVVSVLLLVLACGYACAGRLERVLARGPFPHLQGIVLRQVTGNATAGAWSEPAPGDWDGDGDIDVIAGSGYGDLLYFERRADGFLSEPIQMLPDRFSLIYEPPAPDPVSPQVVDWDGDGAPDILVGMRGRVYLCRRQGSGLAPPQELACGPESVGDAVRRLTGSRGHLAPCAADLDRDGDLDLLLSSREDGTLWYLSNEGSASASKLAAPAKLSAGGQVPAFRTPVRLCIGDWNADGYSDLFLAPSGGGILLCEGSATGPGPARAFWGFSPETGAREAEETSDLCPSFCSWYGPEQGPRLLVGDRRGYFAIIGPAQGGGKLEGFAQAVRPPIDVGRCASPCPVDWDGDGDLDLVVGGEDGFVQLFTRLEASPPLFAAGKRVAGSLGTLRAAPRAGIPGHLRYAWPCVTDADTDGDPDLILGQASGLTTLWANSSGFGKSQEIAVVGQALSLSGMSTVHAMDYDTDGDTDLFVGTRLIPGSVVASQLSPETVLYLENVAGRKAAPRFVKAVRIDASIVHPSREDATRDADILGVTALQPVQWNANGALEYLLTTHFGAFLFQSGAGRNAYPRLELSTPMTGIPAPLVPSSWNPVACRLTGGLPGIVCGLEETGWVVWYDRAQLANGG